MCRPTETVWHTWWGLVWVGFSNHVIWAVLPSWFWDCDAKYYDISAVYWIFLTFVWDNLASFHVLPIISCSRRSRTYYSDSSPPSQELITSISSSMLRVGTAEGHLHSASQVSAESHGGVFSTTSLGLSWVFVSDCHCIASRGVYWLQTIGI